MRTQCLTALLCLSLTSASGASVDPGVQLIHLADPPYKDGNTERWAENDRVYKDVRRLAGLGHVKSQYNFAMLAHMRGEFEDAVYWYKRAALRNHALAAYNLASLYHEGDGVEVNHAEAARWMKLSARLDNPQAQFQLAKMYFHGVGVPQDHAKEAYWYRKAAENGSAAAAHNLAVLYQKGEGVEQSEEQARLWLERSRSTSSGFETRY